MKKLWILVLTGAMLLLLAACGKGAEDNLSETVATEEDDRITVTYYRSEGMGKHLVKETAKLQKLTAQNLIDLLIGEEMLPKGVRVLNYQLEGDIITLNVSGELAEALKGLGSTGEYRMLGSLVNTFLEVYHAKGIDLTSAGQHLGGRRGDDDYILKFFN